MLSDLLTITEKGRVRAIKTRKDWRKKQKLIKEAVLSIIGKPEAKKCPLHPRTIKEEDKKTYIRRKISYWVEKDDRVNAYVLIPKGLIKTFPAVLCLHGTRPEGKDVLMDLPGIEHRDCYDYALDLVKRGYVTLSPDHICAGERIEQGYAAYDTTFFYNKYPNWSAVGKSIWDNMRAIDYLCSLDFVDANRIGCMGHSLGGHSSIFAAAFDKRIKVSFSCCGLATFVGDKKRLNWSRDHWYIYMPKLRPLFLKGKKAPFDWHEVVSLIAPRAFLNSTALNDSCFSSTDAVAELGIKVNKVYRLLGKEDYFSNYLHGQRHSFEPEAKALAYSWFDLWL